MTARALRPDPVAWPPAGLRREQAPRHVGVSPATFDQWVRERRMPEPIRVGGVTLWIREHIETALYALADDRNPIDAALGREG